MGFLAVKEASAASPARSSEYSSSMPSSRPRNARLPLASTPTAVIAAALRSMTSDEKKTSSSIGIGNQWTGFRLPAASSAGQSPRLGATEALKRTRPSRLVCLLLALYDTRLYFMQTFLSVPSESQVLNTSFRFFAAIRA